jgi:hypothetical protein
MTKVIFTELAQCFDWEVVPTFIRVGPQFGRQAELMQCNCGKQLYTNKTLCKNTQNTTINCAI